MNLNEVDNQITFQEYPIIFISNGRQKLDYSFAVKDEKLVYTDAIELKATLTWSSCKGSTCSEVIADGFTESLTIDPINLCTGI